MTVSQITHGSLATVFVAVVVNVGVMETIFPKTLSKSPALPRSVRQDFPNIIWLESYQNHAPLVPVGSRGLYPLDRSESSSRQGWSQGAVLSPIAQCMYLANAFLYRWLPNDRYLSTVGFILRQQDSRSTCSIFESGSEISCPKIYGDRSVEMLKIDTARKSLATVLWSSTGTCCCVA